MRTTLQVEKEEKSGQNSRFEENYQELERRIKEAALAAANAASEGKCEAAAASAQRKEAAATAANAVTPASNGESNCGRKKVTTKTNRF